MKQETQSREGMKPPPSGRGEATSAPREFHAPYLGRNREMYELLRAGRVDEAAGHLAAYLDAAERQLVEAFTSQDFPESRARA